MLGSQIMSNMQLKLQEFRAVWTSKPERSFWPLDLEPVEDLHLAQDLPSPGFGFFLNADDTPRCGAPDQPWPGPIAAVVHNPLPGFRPVANEDRTWAA